MKKIIISKCKECPHAFFDPPDVVAHWGKWVCTFDADGHDDYVLLDEGHMFDGEIPSWCKLEDSEPR